MTMASFRIEDTRMVALSRLVAYGNAHRGQASGVSAVPPAAARAQAHPELGIEVVVPGISAKG